MGSGHDGLTLFLLMGYAFEGQSAKQVTGMTESAGKSKELRSWPAGVLRIASIVLFAIAAAPAVAQHDGHGGNESIGWIPREILERPVALHRDIGNLHEKVTTTSPEAQAFYDQGLDYLSSYVWIEAARAFRQALRLDPSIAAAYAGLCDVYVQLQDVEAARAAIDKARSLAGPITEAERQRIEVRVRQVEFLEDNKNLDKFVAYRKAIYDALMANPRDPGLWILRGFADEGPGAGHGQTGDLDSIAFYQTALVVSPDNAAAHHYLAHSYENIGRTEEALLHAEAYLRATSSIPHAHHMRGHELRRAGRIEDALDEFQTANELEIAYYRAENIPAEYDWHRTHNLSLLAMCYQLLGQMRIAEKLLRESFALPAHGELMEFGRKQWPEFLLARGRVQEAFEQADILAQSPSLRARFAGHTLKGRALVAMNRIDRAREEMAQARDALILIPSSDADRLRPYSDTLRAEIMLADGQSAEGVALMKDIEEQLRAAPGPDARSQALFELDSIARRARESGAWALAETTADRMIEQDPSYGGGHYAKGLAAEHGGNPGVLAQQFNIAEKLWSDADNDLPELLVIRKKLTVEQTELSQTRQEYLNHLRDSSETLKPASAEKVEVSFDPARLRGSADAPVIIVEFSDFQCPFCRKIQPALKSLLAKHAGKVSLAYRDFPLRGMHGQAELGAESSRCAGDQGKFWEYHDLLFANPDKLNRQGLLELARGAKLGEGPFESCLSSGKHRAEVEKDLQDGIRVGVMGTPAIFINGTLLSGAQPESVLEQVIQSELAVAGKRRAAN